LWRSFYETNLTAEAKTQNQNIPAYITIVLAGGLDKFREEVIYGAFLMNNLL
jgi:hypothetical protein